MGIEQARGQRDLGITLVKGKLTGQQGTGSEELVMVLILMAAP